MEVVGAFAAALVSFVALVLWAVFDARLHGLPTGYLFPHRRAPHDAAAASAVKARDVRILAASLTGDAYPTLRLIDQARGEGFAPFSDAPSAAWLEQRARELTGGTGGDIRSLTHPIPLDRLDALCAALDWERRAQENTPRIFVESIITDENPPATAT